VADLEPALKAAVCRPRASEAKANSRLAHHRYETCPPACLVLGEPSGQVLAKAQIVTSVTVGAGKVHQVHRGAHDSG
jgi:hypothetical protein